MSQTVREVVVAAYGRTGIAKARKGGLHLTHPVDFTGQLLAGVVRKVPQLAVSEIDDVVLGCARPQEIQCSNIGRLSALRAGFPASVPGQTVSRLCSSGLQAIGSAANSIAVGEADVIVAGGVEFLTSIGMGTPEQYQCKELKEIDDGPYLSMGITAENVARRYGVSRAEMEALAVESHRRAHAAQEAGVFDAEIVPVNAVQEDGSTALFRRDEGIRPGTTAEKLAELKPCFLEDGLVTAATSSQVSDGAAAVVLMSREKAEQLGVRPIARFLGFAVAGVDPSYMGIGPIYAVPKIMARTGLTVADMDVIELNEAFAAQAIPCIRELGIDTQRQLNPNGGAMALGHPLGATGGILTCKLLNELTRRRGRYGLVTMSVGGGMGAAGIYEMLD